jgi:hypothetical protein
MELKSKHDTISIRVPIKPYFHLSCSRPLLISNKDAEYSHFLKIHTVGSTQDGLVSLDSLALSLISHHKLPPSIFVVFVLIAAMHLRRSTFMKNGST